MALTRKQSIERYDRIVALREQDPPLSYEAIGALFDPPLSRQRVAEIVSLGRPKAIGRPGHADRRERLERKLATWQGRLVGRRERGVGVEEAERRIAELTDELSRVSP